MSTIAQIVPGLCLYFDVWKYLQNQATPFSTFPPPGKYGLVTLYVFFSFEKRIFASTQTWSKLIFLATSSSLLLLWFLCRKL